MSAQALSTAEVESVYTKLAKFYDIWAYLTEGRARRVSLDRAAVKDGESVLEVAVGTGLAFVDLVRANPSGVNEGIDLTEAMLARARRKIDGLPGRNRLRAGDARKLDFADQTFDLVMNGYMFDLLPEESFAPVLAEFRRVLKDGGRVVLVNLADTSSLTSRALGRLYALSPRLMGGCRPVAVAPLVEKAGFREVRVEIVSQLGVPSEVVTARR